MEATELSPINTENSENKEQKVLVNEDQTKSEESNTNTDALEKKNTIYCNTIFSIIFGLLTFLPIITLLMGIFYFDKCNMEPYIPLWLIVYYYFIPLFKVTGVIGIYILSKRIISSWLKAFNLKLKDDTCVSRFLLILNVLLYAFMVLWFLFGNILVYAYYDKVSYDEAGEPAKYCAKACFRYSFWLITMFWIIAVSAIIGFCCISLVCVFLPTPKQRNSDGSSA